MIDTTPRPPGPRPPLQVADALAAARRMQARAAILVEGWSDQAAIDALAARQGAALQAERIVCVPVGGVTKDQGELASFRRFQDQPHQRGREHAAQLRRFMGTRAGRKVRYGALLVNALDLRDTPLPLRRVLERVRQT